MVKECRSRYFYYRIKGEYALFTDPVTKGGGEKFSYQIPTYQAIKGITEQIYWKPTLHYYIDEIKVINKIKTETKGIRAPFKKGGNALNYYTYLKDVEYLVKFHFEWNQVRTDLASDKNMTKHEQILFRCLDKGGRRDLFLGTRECVAYIEEVKEVEYETAESYYKNNRLSFGIMFHSFLYPTEYQQDNNVLIANFNQIYLDNGKIEFIPPEQCEIHHQINNYSYKKIEVENIRRVEEEYQGLFENEVIL